MAYRKILVPLDGSAAARRGLREALKIADARSRLRAIHVLNDLALAAAPEPVVATAAPRVYAALAEAGEKILRGAETMARRQRAKIETATLRSRGLRVADAILREAKRWRADVIVMGTHGRAGVRRVLLGSEAEAVLRRATIPLLLAPPGGRK